MMGEVGHEADDGVGDDDVVTPVVAGRARFTVLDEGPTARMVAMVVVIVVMVVVVVVGAVVVVAGFFWWSARLLLLLLSLFSKGLGEDVSEQLLDVAGPAVVVVVAVAAAGVVVVVAASGHDVVDELGQVRIHVAVALAPVAVAVVTSRLTHFLLVSSL